jgi:hypothetical protein
MILFKDNSYWWGFFFESSSSPRPSWNAQLSLFMRLSGSTVLVARLSLSAELLSLQHINTRFSFPLWNWARSSWFCSKISRCYYISLFSPGSDWNRGPGMPRSGVAAGFTGKIRLYRVRVRRWLVSRPGSNRHIWTPLIVSRVDLPVHMHLCIRIN